MQFLKQNMKENNDACNNDKQVSTYMFPKTPIT